MDMQTCLKKLQYVGVLSFATIGMDATPQIRCISAIHYEPDAFYFFTARGKEFCRELLHDGHVQILAYTRYKEMIRVSTRAVPLPETEQSNYIDLIFREQPYLSHLYPGDTRSIGIDLLFGIWKSKFQSRREPHFRERYRAGSVTMRQKGYRITERCTGCGKCASVCPQQCIAPGKPYRILQEHCLHCGNCSQHCPVQAIARQG